MLDISDLSDPPTLYIDRIPIDSRELSKFAEMMLENDVAFITP